MPEGVAPDSDVTVRDAELDLADALMDTLGEVDMDSLHDDYREAVEELIAAKASGEAVQPSESEDSGGGKVIDLIAALESSVRAAKKSRARGRGRPRARRTWRTSTPSKNKATPRKTAPQKSSPKSTGGKKSTASTAKKTTQKKTTSKSTSSASSSKGTSSANSAKKQTSSGSRSTTKKKTAAPRKRASA
ncbi:Non-homologous end joining protein Ku OS=Streptomyces cyaneofuscatus OX=66883 GN=ku PE=3 SV=1 [Streptomyces cyaneofuscatus]